MGKKNQIITHIVCRKCASSLSVLCRARLLPLPRRVDRIMPQLVFTDDEQGLVSRHFNAGVDSALISVTNDHCCCSNHTFCSQRDFMQPAVFSLSLWVLLLRRPSIFSLFQSLLCILSLSPLSNLIHRLIYVLRTIKLAGCNWTQLLGRHHRSIKGSEKALSALHGSSIHSLPKSNIKPLRMLTHTLFNTGSCCTIKWLWNQKFSVLMQSNPRQNSCPACREGYEEVQQHIQLVLGMLVCNITKITFLECSKMI